VQIWFLQDTARLDKERAAIEHLQEIAEWLVGTTWLLCEGDLCLDAVIKAHGLDYAVRMSYPTMFPNVPPTVRPLRADTRWSEHQYGGGDGPLCLQWGPDNWHPDVTGAQMLESTFTLLDIENPLGASADEAQSQLVARAPSRHKQLLGQELRSTFARFYLGPQVLGDLASLPALSFGSFKFSLHWREKSWLALVHEAQAEGSGTPSIDWTIPNALRKRNGEEKLWNGFFFKTELDGASISGLKGVDQIWETLLQMGHGTTSTTSAGFDRDAAISDFNTLVTKVREDDPANQYMSILMLDTLQQPHAFISWDGQKTYRLARLYSEDAGRAERTPAHYASLEGKTIGIVGLGSVGGKVALTLARMGVRNYLLVDYDVLLPENIQRHVLDWGSIGEHKVDAVRGELMLVAADMKVDVSYLHLTGQESTAAVSRVLEKLGECDLLIDATADAAVFNLIAAVATGYEKPMVWAQVYAGGVGGMVARSHPGYDPNPHTMRAIYNQFCVEHPAPEVENVVDYTVESDGGQMLSASDTDVSIIAHHAARLAADTLVDREGSLYPHSMYLIGLADWWVFTAPFHTIPIATDVDLQTETETSNWGESHSQAISFIARLLEAAKSQEQE
jgi:molybdopterin/thiamine biosynthesis adenylyltransferase